MSAKTSNSRAKAGFAGLDAIIGSVDLSGLTSDSKAWFSVINLSEIVVKKQIREEFEDGENSLANMAKDIQKQGIVQPILVRPLGEREYELIAGERRVRASRLAGIETIPAYVRVMTDEEAEDAQFAENVQRKNFTQLETAKQIQKDIDELGSVEAVLERRNMNRSAVSKLTGLLKLSDEAKRLLTENISADLEVISAVRQLEAADPAKAKEVVDNLKVTRGKSDARKQATGALRDVKSAKKVAASKGGAPKAKPAPAPAGKTPTNANASGGPVFSPEQALGALYESLMASGGTSKKAMKSLSDDDRTETGAWLYQFFDSGKRAVSRGKHGPALYSAIQSGMTAGQFGTAGASALQLAAFLLGTTSEALAGGEYDVFVVLDAVKAGKPA